MPNTNLTFAELQEAVRTEMQLDPGLISAAERSRFLNDALKDLGTINGFERSVDLVITDGKAPLPDDFVSLIGVHYEGLVLRPVGIHPTEITSGSPIGFYILYDTLVVYPATQSCTVKLFYTYRPSVMVNPTDQPNLPNGWDRMLIDYAVASAHRKNGQVGLYREYMSAYDYEKSKLQLELIRRFNSRVTSTVNSEVAENPGAQFDFL